VICSTRSAAIAVGILAAFAAPSVSSAATPPNPHDPCSTEGRDTCGTLGVGFYRTYSYGVRWFGDYRGAVPDAAHSFCLDLGYWYASPSYRYRHRPAASLRDRSGELVPAEQQREIAYAIWRYGQSTKPARQAAVMLYVHSRMGDAQPGEADAAAVNSTVASLYASIARDTHRNHGPYRIETRLPRTLRVGKAVSASLRVLSAHGAALPHVRLTLAATGATGLPSQLHTNGAGVATFALTPTATAGLELRLATEPLATARPRVFVPTAARAIANGQRLAVPASKRATAHVSRTDVAASPQISTQVSAQVAAPGARISDAVTVSGLGGSSATVHVELWGPFASRDAIACSGTPFWKGSFVAAGDGTTTTTPVSLTQAGYYTYRESIAAHAPSTGSPSTGSPSTGFATTCGETAETTFVQGQPELVVMSEQVVRPGAPLSARISVKGLGTTPAAVDVELFGPFASRSAISCSHRDLRWSGRIAVPGSGTVQTPAVKVTHAGFYGYRESVAATPLVAGSTTTCAADGQSALVAPQIATGRGDARATVSTAATAAGGSVPVRIQIASLTIDAPVAPAAIALARGALAVPNDIRRVGWWRDSASPASGDGSMLIAGHRDSARAGEGAFFRLERAVPGTAIEVSNASGRTFAYRVASVRHYPRRALPTSVFAHAGRPRLVLVTCGGPFDDATGHYRDNIVVTALPIR
jgi:hypothetical protein